jgi:hypothetical protein
MSSRRRISCALLVSLTLVACNGRSGSGATDTAAARGAAVSETSAAARTGARADSASRDSVPLAVLVPRDTAAPADSLLVAKAPLVPMPKVVRGLYVNRWQALGTAMWDLVDVAKRTEVNALVLDVKDDRGFLLYPSTVPLAREIGADTNRPMRPARVRAILDTMHKYGIYPIARIVVAKDPLLAEKKHEWAIKRRSDPTQPWLDKNGRAWLDPHHYEIWGYAADLAREAIDLGFSEVQLDYVRFPDEDRIIHEGVFPLAQGRVRAQVIRDQLGRMRRELAPTKVPFTIDVFGLTSTDTTDMGIGQRWEAFIDRADVVLPMTYPSHYNPGTYGIRDPNGNPYGILDHALKDAKRRSAGIPGAAEIRPWYQDFTLGPPRYGVAELRAQMKAGYDNGIQSWVLWNPRSAYTIDALRPESDSASRPSETAPTAKP